MHGGEAESTVPEALMGRDERDDVDEAEWSYACFSTSERTCSANYSRGHDWVKGLNIQVEDRRRL